MKYILVRLNPLINSKHVRKYIVQHHFNKSANNDKLLNLLQDLKKEEQDGTPKKFNELEKILRRGSSEQVYDLYENLKQKQVKFSHNQVNRILSKLKFSPAEVRVERVMDVLNYCELNQNNVQYLESLFYSLISTYRFEESNLVMNNLNEANKKLSIENQLQLLSFYLKKLKTLSGMRLHRSLVHSFENGSRFTKQGHSLLANEKQIEVGQLSLLYGFLSRGDFINLIQSFWKLVDQKVYLPINMVERIVIGLIRGNKLIDCLDVLSFAESKSIRLKASVYFKLMEKLNLTNRFQHALNLYYGPVLQHINSSTRGTTEKFNIRFKLLLVETYIGLDEVNKAKELHQTILSDPYFTDNPKLFINISNRIQLKLRNIDLFDANSPSLIPTRSSDSIEQVELSKQVEMHLSVYGIEKTETFFETLLKDKTFHQIPAKVYNALLKGYLHTSLNQFQWLLELMTSNQICSDKLTYEFMFKALASVAYNGKPTEPTLTSTNSIDTAREEVQINTEELASLRAEQQRQTSVQLTEMADRLYMQLQLENFLPTIDTFKYATVTFTYLKKFGQIQQIMLYCIRTDTFPDVDLINLTLKELLEMDQFEEALTLLHQLANYSILPQLKNFAYLIQNRISNSRMEEVDLVYDSMVRLSIAPDLQLFTRIIKGYLDCNELQRSIVYFRKLKAYNLQPDAVLTSVLTQVLIRSKQFAEARKLVEAMPQLELKIDVINLTSLVSPYLIRSGLTDVEHFLSYVRSLNVEPDDRMYLALLKALISKTNLNGTLSHLIRLWPDFHPHQIIWDHLLLLSSRRLENLKVVVEFVGKINTVGIQPNQEILVELAEQCIQFDELSLKAQLDSILDDHASGSNKAMEEGNISKQDALLTQA